MNNTKGGERFIYHFTERRSLDASRINGSYTPLTFDREGFIHCSTREQLLHVANRIAPRDIPLVLLVIDTTRVPHKIIYENLEGGDTLFPHIYGLLPLDAVMKAMQFRPGGDGTFSWPEEGAEL
jgi:uncharacterized protein (DUF952 family)